MPDAVTNATKLTVRVFLENAQSGEARRILKALLATRCKVAQVKGAMEKMRAALPVDPLIQTDINHLERLLQAMQVKV